MKKVNLNQNHKLPRFSQCLNLLFVTNLHGIKPRTVTRANSHRMTTSEEALIRQLLEADKRGFPIRPEFLRTMAQLLL